MLAIAQSKSTYHFLNWIPSEQGPLVTQHGSLQKELIDLNGEDQHYFDVLNNIFSQVENGEPIYTFSLDRTNVLFSTCYAEDSIQEMIDWHLTQSSDDQLKMMMDFYHYPMGSKANTILNIGIAKGLRNF